MAEPGIRNLTIYRGDTYTHRLLFFDDEARTQPSDLSGRDYAAQIRKSPDAAGVLAFTVDDTDAASGVLVLRLTADEATTVLPLGVWDLEETVGIEVTTLLAGAVVGTMDVTRPASP